MKCSAGSTRSEYERMRVRQCGAAGRLSGDPGGLLQHWVTAQPQHQDTGEITGRHDHKEGSISAVGRTGCRLRRRSESSLLLEKNEGVLVCRGCGNGWWGGWWCSRRPNRPPVCVDGVIRLQQSGISGSTTPGMGIKALVMQQKSLGYCGGAGAAGSAGSESSTSSGAQTMQVSCKCQFRMALR